jgi:hypothetical protein
VRYHRGPMPVFEHPNGRFVCDGISGSLAEVAPIREDEAAAPH